MEYSYSGAAVVYRYQKIEIVISNSYYFSKQYDLVLCTPLTTYVREKNNGQEQGDSTQIWPKEGRWCGLEWPQSYYFDKIAIADLCTFKIGMRSELDLNFIPMFNGMSSKSNSLLPPTNRLHAVFSKVIIERRRLGWPSVIRRNISVWIWLPEHHLKVYSELPR